MNNISRIHRWQRQAGGNGMAQRAFTLIELMVIIAVISTLAVLLLPTWAGARASAAKAECAANLRQLGAAITLFASDHTGMFPPAGDSLSNSNEISWDTYVNFYITGVHLTSKELMVYEDGASVPRNQSPGILLCPADTGPDTTWVAGFEQSTGHLLGRRTYAMNVSSVVQGVGWQINVQTHGYQLPTVLQGVGVYWEDDTNNMLNAPSLKTSVVLLPANLILLAEEACGNNIADNVWPCICEAPYTTAGTGIGELAQIAPNDTNSQGAALYANHGNTFNYLFCDNHVSALTMQQTVGNGTITNKASAGNGIVGPRGYWINNTNYTAN